MGKVVRIFQQLIQKRRIKTAAGLDTAGSSVKK